MPEVTDMMVDFEKCKNCQHWKDPECSDICNDCLDYPYNTDSTTPIHFKSKENKTNDK